MNKFRNFAALAGIAASLGCASAMAQSQARTAQPSQQPAQPSQQVAQPQGQTTTVNGLQLKPDGGSGPDKTKFNIVSKSEAKKQQGAMHSNGGNSMTSDGTGGGENSSGN